jgi:large subunit ribosomal protein L30
LLAVIRIRGRTGIREPIEDTLRKLRLTRINHMVFIPESKEFKGMLLLAKDYITWGEVSKETLILALKHRALLRGRKKIDEDAMKDAIGYASFDEVADFLLSGKTLTSIENLVPVLRLNPPRGGHEFIRKSFKNGGTSGYRGEEINVLIKKMLKEGVDLNGTN